MNRFRNVPGEKTTLNGIEYDTTEVKIIQKRSDTTFSLSFDPAGVGDDFWPDCAIRIYPLRGRKYCHWNWKDINRHRF